MGTAGPDKDRVIAALVLAISHSPLGDATGSDALREVLRVEYHDMLEGSSFDMEQLWELLEDQPGFSAEAAKGPLSLLKSWESRLDIEFRLPDQMAEMSDRDRQLAAGACRIPPAEMNELFHAQAADAPAKPKQRDAPRSKRASLGGAELHPTPATPNRKPAWMGILALLFAVGGFSFAGYNGYQYCNPSAGDWNDFSKANLVGLPVTSASKLGVNVSAKLDLAAWKKLDPQEQRKQLRTALLQNEARGVKVIIVTAEGTRIASVQRTASGELSYWPTPEAPAEK